MAGNIIICVQNQDSPQAIAILKHQCHLEAGFAFQKKIALQVKSTLQETKTFLAE